VVNLKISIALATFNGARFLKEQLASLAAQTFLPAELIVTDDGSTDETLAIL
jgi:glycosyltransferase involved in cell wall biosynthesis